MDEASAERPPSETPKTNAEGFEILSETLEYKRYVRVVDRVVKLCPCPSFLHPLHTS